MDFGQKKVFSWNWFIWFHELVQYKIISNFLLQIPCSEVEKNHVLQLIQDNYLSQNMNIIFFFLYGLL